MTLRPFFSALRFLTIFPIPESWCGDEADFYRSPDWYPVVGVFIGILLVCADVVLRWLFPVPVASILLLVAMLGVSGALHLDGLADSADAFFSSRGKEQMLEIMKDSRSGPMGVTAIVLLLLLKLMLLISLPVDWRWQAIFLAPLAGRSSLALVSSWFSYARTQGTGEFTQQQSSGQRVLVTLGIVFVTAILFLHGSGFVVFVAFVAAVWLLGLYSQRKIGGYTGDTLGATCEIIELIPLLGVVMLSHAGLL